MRRYAAPGLVLALLSAPALAQGGAALPFSTIPPGAGAGLADAFRRFPPPILGGNVQAAAANAAVPPACPAAGSRVEQKGGPTIEFLAGANVRDLCRVRIGGDVFDAWFGIWGQAWPGGDAAHRALAQVIHGRTGDAVGFDTVAQPGVAEWHDIVRNDGVEDIPLLGRTYHALKLAHYREGYGGNTYRSVATLWVDLLSGLPLYATYQHIAGKPELDSPLIPTAILPASPP